MPSGDSMSPGALGGESGKFAELVDSVEGVLRKDMDARNVTDQTIMNKFIAKSQVLSQLAEVLSFDAVKNMLKYAAVHQVGGGRVLLKKGADIDRVVVMLKG